MAIDDGNSDGSDENINDDGDTSGGGEGSDDGGSEAEIMQSCASPLNAPCNLGAYATVTVTWLAKNQPFALASSLAFCTMP